MSQETQTVLYIVSGVIWVLVTVEFALWLLALKRKGGTRRAATHASAPRLVFGTASLALAFLVASLVCVRLLYRPASLWDPVLGHTAVVLWMAPALWFPDAWYAQMCAALPWLPAPRNRIEERAWFVWTLRAVHSLLCITTLAAAWMVLSLDV